MGVGGGNHSPSKLFTYLAGTYAREKFRATTLLRVQFHPGGETEQIVSYTIFFTPIILLLILLLQTLPISQAQY